MWPEAQPGHQRASHRSQNLGANIERDLLPGKGPLYRKGQRDGRVELSLARSCRTVDANKNSHRPAKANDDPPAVAALCFFQHHITHNTLPQIDDQACSDKFAEKWR